MLFTKEFYEIMSETNEIQSRVDSVIDVIKRNNPTMKMQLLVAAGVYYSLKREANGKIADRESELEVLKQEVNEVLNIYPNE